MVTKIEGASTDEKVGKHEKVPNSTAIVVVKGYPDSATIIVTSILSYFIVAVETAI